MAQDHGLCRKKGKVKNEPVHGPPLQARVAAANGTVQQLANMLVWLKAILAHMEGTGATKQNEWGKANLNGGKNVDVGSGHGRQRVNRHTAC